jgi:lipoprotein-releasing system ATP-binding protein
MLIARNIYKNYGALPVLKGVDIEILKGEIVSIAGSSGAGKSTLLHILGTLDTADQGEILLENEKIDKLKGKKLASFRNTHIGFVFQFHHLLPEFTALENVCIPGWIAGRKRKEVMEKAESLLHLLGLKNRGEHKPNELSGGEQQRVAVAGIHRFVIGHIEMGILYFFTGGLCLIGTIVDAIIHKDLAMEYNAKMIAETLSMLNMIKR